MVVINSVVDNVNTSNTLITYRYHLTYDVPENFLGVFEINMFQRLIRTNFKPLTGPLCYHHILFDYLPVQHAADHHHLVGLLQTNYQRQHI